MSQDASSYRHRRSFGAAGITSRIAPARAISGDAFFGARRFRHGT